MFQSLLPLFSPQVLSVSKLLVITGAELQVRGRALGKVNTVEFVLVSTNPRWGRLSDR